MDTQPAGSRTRRKETRLYRDRKKRPLKGLKARGIDITPINMPTKFLGHGSMKYIILCYAKTQRFKPFDYGDFEQFSLKRWGRSEVKLALSVLLKLRYLVEIDGKYKITEDGKYALYFVAEKHRDNRHRRMLEEAKRGGLLRWKPRSGTDDDE